MYMFLQNVFTYLYNIIFIACPKKIIIVQMIIKIYVQNHSNEKNFAKQELMHTDILALNVKFQHCLFMDVFILSAEECSKQWSSRWDA